MSTYKIITDKMVFGGNCIAKIQGKTVFIPYAIPGEKLEVEITKDFKDYSQAKIISILEPSPYRVQAFCPLYTKCGGCNMQHISYEHQLELKKSILQDAFFREEINLLPEQIEVICDKPKSYRSRFQFHNGGLMEKSTNNIIPIENCPCACDEINHFLCEVPFQNRPKGRIQIFASKKITSIPDDFDKIVIAALSEAELEKQKLKLENRKNFRQSQQLKNQQRFTPNGRKLKKQKQIKPMYSGSTGNSQNACELELCGKKIIFDVQGFFQSNLEVLEKTIPIILEDLSGKNVLDMYAGCGTFSKFLADKFEKICLVEHNRSALVYAEQNLAGIKHESFGLSGDVWAKYHAENYIKQNGDFDAVVIDPPRSGMEKSVCQWLCQSGIPKIKSLSCDIATHARDAKFLIKSGYNLKKIYLLDFYPQTSHIESLAVFEKDFAG